MWCNNYIHVPFSDKGRDRNGCDCWGLARLIYKEQLNIELPLLLDYNDTKDRFHISNVCEIECKEWQEIKTGQEKPFDVLVFKILSLPCHVGVVIEKGLMIHCEKGCGTHLTEYNKEVQWYHRLAGVYRYVK